MDMVRANATRECRLEGASLGSSGTPRPYLTVTVVEAVPLFPAGSIAVAVIVCEVPDGIAPCCFFSCPGAEPAEEVVVVETLQVKDRVDPEDNATCLPSIVRVICETLLLSVALTLIGTFPLTTAPLSGVPIVTFGGMASFATVIVILVELPSFPAASKAVACSVLVPSGTFVVSQLKAYGESVSVAYATPFTQRTTFVTPMLSVAFTLTGTMPFTVLEVEGVVIVAVGDVVSVAAVVCRAEATAPDALTRPQP